jgi:hypothetical protein
MDKKLWLSVDDYIPTTNCQRPKSEQQANSNDQQPMTYDQMGGCQEVEAGYIQIYTTAYYT